MKIDERALEVAANVYAQSILGVPVVGLDTHRSEVIVEAMRSALEAYEVAKPSPWRPIEEAQGGEIQPETQYLVCLVDTRNEIYDAFLDENGNSWCFHDYDGGFEISYQDLVSRGAMYRTIDPPS